MYLKKFTVGVLGVMSVCMPAVASDKLLQIVGKQYADGNFLNKVSGDTMTGALTFDVAADDKRIKTPIIVKGASSTGEGDMSLQFSGGVFSIRDGSDYTLLQVGRDGSGNWYMESGADPDGDGVLAPSSGMRLGTQVSPLTNIWSSSIQSAGGKRLMVPEFPSYSCGSEGLMGSDCQLVVAPVPEKKKGIDQRFILRDMYNKNGVHSYKWQEFPIPASLPTAAGTYTLEMTVASDGSVTGKWVKK